MNIVIKALFLIGCLGLLSACDDTTNNIIQQGPQSTLAFTVDDLRKKRYVITEQPQDESGDISVIEFINENQVDLLEVNNNGFSHHSASWSISTEGTLLVSLDNGHVREYSRQSLTSRRILVESQQGKQQFITLPPMIANQVVGKQFSILSADDVFLSIRIDPDTHAFYLFNDALPAGIWSIVDGYVRLTFDNFEVSGSEQIDIALIDGNLFDGDAVVISRKAEAEPTNLRNRKVEKAKQYTGDLLSLNFQDIEVRSALTLLADFANLQMVIDPTVNQSITLRLRDIPFDAALDVIVKSSNLEMSDNNNIFVIAAKGKIKPYYSNRMYTGDKLSLNFQNIEIRSILQLISDFSSKNIVVDDDVTDSMSMRLSDVPVDQALDIVIMVNGLQRYENEFAILLSKA